jgi:hypothetical protein
MQHTLGLLLKLLFLTTAFSNQMESVKILYEFGWRREVIQVLKSRFIVF